MKKIPKKYLSAKFKHEARSLVRSWSQKSESDEELVKELIEAYRVAKEQDRFHLGTLLAMVFDLQCPDAARECARLFEVPLSEECSVSEAIYAGGATDDAPLYWRKEFSLGVKEWLPIVAELDTEKYPMVVSPSMADRILTISRSDAMYAYRQFDGTLHLFILNSSDEDILIDEEQFMEEAPLYFTENEHFVSPVFQLRLVKRLLDFVLSEVGYPPLKIAMTAVFVSPQAHLLNYDCYVPGGDNAKDWKGITTIMRRNHLNEYLFTDANYFYMESGRPDTVEYDIYSNLLWALAAASILYENVNRNKKLEKYSSAYLRSLCREYDIFS